MPMRVRGLLHGGAALMIAALALAGCADDTPPTPSPSPLPTGEAWAESLPPVLTTDRAVTVLESDDGPQLCVGGVFTSYPPCGAARSVDAVRGAGGRLARG